MSIETERATAHPAAHAATPEDVVARLRVDPRTGLSPRDVRRRRRRHGPNILARRRARTALSILCDQLRSVVVMILIAAAVLSFLFGDWIDGTAVGLVVTINTAIGFISELKAARSMEALRRLGAATAKVRRNGRMARVPARELVPGDIVILDSGDLVPADLRLLAAANLHTDESALTGESAPVAKDIEPLADDAPLAERASMLYRGTPVTRGRGEGVVVATAMATEIGRVAALAQAAEPEMSPLEKRLDRLGHQLVWATLALTAVIAAAGIVTGHAPLDMVETGVALAVAAVPEGLPIVATVALARGMWRMAQRNALINRLSAVETLGATTIILVDKTGTLTENRMAAVRLLLPGGAVDIAAEEATREGNAFSRDGRAIGPGDDPELRLALTIAVLCNEARPGGNGHAGDPMETALIRAGAKAGMRPGELLEAEPKLGEEAFARETMMMATAHGRDRAAVLYVKGAPEAVISHSTKVIDGQAVRALDRAGREAWLRRNEDLAGEGLRVLALATKPCRDAAAIDYDGLTLVGLIGLVDPARADVPEAIAACRRAGVRVVMVTGDHARTARKIADDIGLAWSEAGVVEGRELGPPDRLSPKDRERLRRASILARVTPETKLALVGVQQEAGEIVAMTGDGVNDAPALKKADIGIAMGKRGSDVAREAAHMVLRDDAFPSIVEAMRQGRVIFGNIRAFVVYLLSCNLSEILLIALAVASGLPLPLLPLQILYLNLVTDVFPAFALGIGEGGKGVMRRPPRNPGEPIVGRAHWTGIALFAALIALSTLAAFVIALKPLAMPARDALTVSFLALALAQLWHVFNMRTAGSGLIVNEVTRNPFIWLAIALCVVLISVAVTVPPLSGVLGLSVPGTAGLTLALAASVVPVAVGQMAAGLFGLAVLAPPARS